MINPTWFLSIHLLLTKTVFQQYAEGQNLLLHGAAGTGKTFITLYLALQEVLDESTPYDKIYIVRSLVPTREIGFLPGDHEDKSALYQIPYKNMVRYMFSMPDDNSFEMLYDNLRAQELLVSGLQVLFAVLLLIMPLLL